MGSGFILGIRNGDLSGGYCSTNLGSETKRDIICTFQNSVMIILNWKKDTKCSSANTNFRGTKRELEVLWTRGPVLRQNTASQMPASLQGTGSMDQISTPHPGPPHPPVAPAVVFPAGEPEGAVTRIAVGSQVVREPTGHLENRWGQVSNRKWAIQLLPAEPCWGQQESQRPNCLWGHQTSRSDVSSTRKASKSFSWRGLQTPLR